MIRPLLALLLVGAGACTAQQVLLQSTDVAALSAASTFAIEPPQPGTTGAAMPRDRERLRSAIEAEIVRSLVSKGYRPADPGSADLVVSYHLAYMGRVALHEHEDAIAESRVTLGPGTPYTPYQPLPDQAQGERREMLLVTIADRKSSTVLWQASNEGLATSTGAAVREVSGATSAALAKVPKSHGARN